MKRFARLEGPVVAEIIIVPQDGPPIEDLFHPSVVAACVPAPDDAVAEGWRWHDGAFSPSPAKASAAAIRRIAPLSFRRRFSAATRAAITLAASRALEAGEATLQTWLDDIAACRVVDLDDPELQAGIGWLEEQGLVTQAEAVALLADGTPEEV